jgi:hypothetical protein
MTKKYVPVPRHGNEYVHSKRISLGVTKSNGKGLMIVVDELRFSENCIKGNSNI